MRLEKSIVINRPVETVFAFVSDMNKVPLWLPIKNIRQTSAGPVGVGATFWQAVEVFGQRYEGVVEVTEFVPDSSFAFKSIESPIPLSNRMTFTPQAGATLVTLIADIEPGNVLKLAGPFLKAMAKKQLDTQVAKLKQLIESA